MPPLVAVLGGPVVALMAGLVPGRAAQRALVAGAQNLVTLFIGIELLSIPLYILCGSRVRQEHSLEAGIKYLIVGSVGSATLLYGLALIYGATGSTDLAKIGHAIGTSVPIEDPLVLTGIAL